MRWRRLAIALLVVPIACGGVGESQEFREVARPVQAGEADQGPAFPTMTVTNPEGEAIRVEAYSWARAQGSAGSGSRAPEHWIIETRDGGVTLDLPYSGVAVILTANGVSRSANMEPMGEGRFRLPIPGSGEWKVDLLAISGADYATFAFTVDAG